MRLWYTGMKKAQIRKAVRTALDKITRREMEREVRATVALEEPKAAPDSEEEKE